MKRVDTIRPRSRAVRPHVRSLGLPDETAIQLRIVDGRISTELVAEPHHLRRRLDPARLVDAPAMSGLGNTATSNSTR